MIRKDNKSNYNITRKNLKKFREKFNKNNTNKVFKNINTKDKFKKLVTKANYMQNKKQVFKNFVNVNSKITNQHSSGRCWIFAFLNVMRLPMIKKYKLNEDFEFSQTYLFFYDKLEKANFFLNYIFTNKTTKLSDIKLISMLDELTSDGGHWNIFVSLIEKYGIIPKTNMNDLYHSKNSYELTRFYNNFLRKAAHKIRTTNQNKDSLKKEIMYECYKILVIFLGEPPNKFNWEYYKKGKKSNIAKSINNITPLEFYEKYVPYDCSTKVCLINYPCKHVPFYNLYNVELAFNITQDRLQNFINVPIEVMVECVKKSVDKNETVWTGIDSSKFISKEEGFMDPGGFNFIDIFGYNNIMNKCDSLNYRQSAPNHAVVIRGYNLNKYKDKDIQDKTYGFLIENSWGDDNGFKGNYYMSLEWFNRFVYEVVIDKKHLPNKVLNVLKKKPILLPYTSPFGSLMKNIL